MNQPFFSVPGKIEVLRAAAVRWLGTPFCVRGAVKGGGVSCHRLCAELYKEAGHLPLSFAPPNGRADWARWRRQSQMAEWLDRSPFFQPADASAPEPGDLLGLQGPGDGCVNHLAVMLDGGDLIHCLRPHGVQIVPFSDPTFSHALRAKWRPLAIPRTPHPQ